MVKLRFFEIKGDKASDRVAVYEDELLGEWVSREQAEQLQQLNSELMTQVELLRNAAQPIINDYFHWMEVNEVDISELTESYQNVYDMMVNLNGKLKSTPAQCLAEHDREVAARAGRAGYLRCAEDFGLDIKGTYVNGWAAYQLANFYANTIRNQKDAGNE